jgi:hypothetical protein
VASLNLHENDHLILLVPVRAALARRSWGALRTPRPSASLTIKRVRVPSVDQGGSSRPSLRDSILECCVCSCCRRPCAYYAGGNVSLSALLIAQRAGFMRAVVHTHVCSTLCSACAAARQRASPCRTFCFKLYGLLCVPLTLCVVVLSQAATPPMGASPGAAPIPIPGGGQLDLQRMLMELATAFTASTGSSTACQPPSPE